MHISHTRTISIAAPPAAVHAYVADARNLPDWAPDFASGVRPDGELWAVTKDAATFPIRVRTSGEHGTVDLLDPEDDTRGAFARVIPNADGSEFLFTLSFPDGTPPDAIENQMNVVATELDRVRSACE